MINRDNMERAVEGAVTMGYDKYVQACATIQNPTTEEREFRVALQEVMVFRNSGLTVIPEPNHQIIAAMIANYKNEEKLEMLTATIKEGDIKKVLETVLQIALGGGTKEFYTVEQRCRLLEEAAVLVDRLVVREIDHSARELVMEVDIPMDRERTESTRTRFIETMAAALHDPELRKALEGDGRRERWTASMQGAFKVEKKERPTHNRLMAAASAGRAVAKDIMAAEREKMRKRRT
ncbi:MAG: hypothetical protein Q7S22_00460 [Candidatus Micrarchaeota archaeon]|nr:hypothetical protein [Candidatus Micrarchaeota archaeon]